MTIGRAYKKEKDKLNEEFDAIGNLLTQTVARSEILHTTSDATTQGLFDALQNEVKTTADFQNSQLLSACRLRQPKSL